MQPFPKLTYFHFNAHPHFVDACDTALGLGIFSLGWTLDGEQPALASTSVKVQTDPCAFPSRRTWPATCRKKRSTTEGTTVEQLATRALERDLARRWLDRPSREGDLRRGSMPDAEVEALVERAVKESRAES